MSPPSPTPVIRGVDDQLPAHNEALHEFRYLIQQAKLPEADA